ncbi:MAG: hypothetical protein WBA25_15675 [Jannaschia sp.]
MKFTIAALATATALSFGSAALADAHTSEMSAGFDMLQAALMSDFERMGIPTDALDDLTLGEISAIKQIVESDDNDGQKKGRIEAIIAD